MAGFILINDDNFEKEILNSSLAVLVEFGAEWCVPCKRLEPVLMELGRQWLEKIRLARVDVDKSVDLTMRFQVMTVPTVILFVKGTAVQRVSGLQSCQKLTEKFRPYL